MGGGCLYVLEKGVGKRAVVTSGVPDLVCSHAKSGVLDAQAPGLSHQCAEVAPDKQGVDDDILLADDDDDDKVLSSDEFDDDNPGRTCVQ